MSMNTTDRISELPEAILHHILSYLSIRDAARTSVLSNWLNNAWKTLPYLNFNDKSFMTRNSYWWQFEKNMNLLEEVQRIVLVRSQQQTSIEKFSLCLLPWKDEHLQQFFDGEVDGEEEKEKRGEIGFSSFSVISYVATPFLRELALINGITLHSGLYLPPSLVCAERLTSLSLFGFDLSSSLSSLDIKFTCLQKLFLKCVTLDDSIMENLIMGSRSSLETLELENFIGLKTIHLGGEFVKLKRVMVDLSEEVVAEVYDAPKFEDLHILNIYRPCECYFDLKNYTHLRKVFFDGNFINDHNLNQFLASFKHLEEFGIRNCSFLKNVNISSDSIKTLSLYSLYNLTKLHIFSPTLKSFTFELSEHKFDFSLNGCVVGFQVNLIIHNQCGFTCVKFLQNFKHARMVILKYDCHQLITIPEYIREKLLSPLYGTRDISFKQGIESWIFKDMVTKLVEILLWLAPRAERISLVSFDSITLLSLKLMYYNEEEKKNFSCCYCKSLPVDCWRHCLKEVRIHKFEETEHNLAKMKDFFLKEVKDLQILENFTY